MVNEMEPDRGRAAGRGVRMVAETGEEIGASMAQARLGGRAGELAVRRRSIVEREEESPREAKELHHAIALGTVLVGRGARARDSWRLDGLLSGTVEDLVARLNAAAARLPGKAAGVVLVGALDDDAAVLDAKGRFAAWRRKYRAYIERYDRWLATSAAFREQGDWRTKVMTAGQAELIRLTAALLEIDLPGELDRGRAHDWIENNGAPLRYRAVPR